MELMTSRWTDDRMDDLKGQVEEIGRRVDEGFAQLRGDLREHRQDMDGRLDKIDERFDKIDERFNRSQEMVIGLHATLTRFSLGLAGAVIVAVVAALTAS
jgi:archaellum component FlaC